MASLSIFGGIGCAALFRTSLIPSLLAFSAVALPIISFFQGRGYAIISGIFAIVFSMKIIGTTLFPGLWISGLGSVFIIAWGLFWLGGTFVIKEEEKVVSRLDQLTREMDENRSIYQQDIQKKIQENVSLVSRSQSLERELQDCQELLKEAYKKQKHLAIDLQVLSDQKNSWLEDYAILHNEYIHLVAGDEGVVFPWVSEQEVLGKSQESKIQDLKEKGMAFLQSELAEEKRQHQFYASRCEELSESLQKVGDLQTRMLELQKLLKQKDKELEQLRDSSQNEESEGSLIEDPEEKRYRCMYQQLREQFSEKDKVLSAVRKELFAVREQYLTLKKEQQLDIECPLEEVLLIQKLLSRIEFLEEEIIHLEELVSRTLCL